MRKPSKPWYRAFNDTWYVCHQGKQVSLAKGKDNEKQALQAFYRLMADGVTPRPERMAVATLFDSFLEHAKLHCKPSTYEWYQGFLQKFVQEHGRLPITSLKVHHVQKWLDKKTTWKIGTRRGAIMSLKRACSWAVDQDYITENPLRKLKTPPAQTRDRYLTDAERQLIRAAYRPEDPWSDFLTALEESGARPGEVASVTAAHVNLEVGIWTFAPDQHKTGGKTRKPRIVFLTPVLLEITRKLVAKFPTGPLFRNRRGKAWDRNSIRQRFRRIRKKLNLGGDLVAYLFRHSYVTNALVNGVPIATTAQLVGHADTAMVSKHYSKLHEATDHLRKMAEQATKRASDA